MLRESALENLARLYESNGKIWSAIATYQILALDIISEPQTQASAYYELARLYSKRGCKIRARFCSWMRNKYYD